MKKTEFLKIFNDAIKEKSEYIAVKIQTEGSSRSEVIINPFENFKDKLKYYKTAYDEEMVLVAAKGKKDIRITDVAAGESFSDIEIMLMGERPKWKEAIAAAADKVVNKMFDEFPDVTNDQREACMVIFEGYKEQFYKNRYTVNQQKFIAENQELYEDMFETCMNGSNEEFKTKFINLSKELNDHA